MKEEWFVYVLECSDGSFYTGISNDVEKRIEKHKSGIGSKYVAAKGFSQLLIKKKFKDKSTASKVEYEIKQLPKRKKVEFLS